MRPRLVLSFAALSLALAALALAATDAPSAPPPFAAFQKFFTDETLRVDYYHTGDSNEELVALDRLYRQGTWAGSRTHLLDHFDNGGYYVKVYDVASGMLIYSRGYDTYFGEYRTSAPALKGVKRTFHESALIPFPRDRVRFTIESRARDKQLHLLFETELDPSSTAVSRKPLTRDVTVIPEFIGGDPHACVDVAILAEGYTAKEEEKFRRDLHRYAEIFFSVEPYKSRRSQFNIRGVFKASEESGNDEPGRGVFRNSALGTTFDSLGSERYVLTEDNRALRDVAAHAPYDILYVMINQSRYGGGGIYNLFCTFTADNQWSPYVFLHEFGHAFAGLADEYYTSSVAYNEFYPKGVEPTEPNITALLPGARLKWAELVTPGTAVPTPWEKAGFDTLDRGFQKRREELNRKIAQRMRAGAPDAEVLALKDDAERLSKEHADQIDAYLAKSAFKGKVGAFEGAGYAAEGLYRSELDCIMFTKGSKPFCAACRRGIEKVIEHYAE